MIKARYTLLAVPEPVSYEVLLIEGRAEFVIDRMLQEDGSYKLAVRNDCRHCFPKEEIWDFESMPSDRPEDWIATHRFDTFEEACELAQRAAELMLTDYKERVLRCNEHSAQQERERERLDAES